MTQVKSTGRVIPHGLTVRRDGSIILSGPALAWFGRLDAAIVSLAADWSGVEFMFPPVVPAADLERLDYFTAFPHLMTVPATLPADPATLHAFAEHSALDADGAVPLPSIAPVRHVLTPAACYPVYPVFKGSALAQPVYATVRATCFRHEASFTPLRRQWTFTMREIVCIGDAQEVAAFALRARGAVETLIDRLGLDHRWESASDPFFQPQRDGRALLQRLDPVKAEAVVDELAISSVNVHHEHFGAAFDVRRGAMPAHSGCVAFGLERWLGVVADSWGPDPDNWPNPGSEVGTDA